MSIHTLTFEDGSVFEVEGARNASEEELVAKIKRGEGTKLSLFERTKQDAEAARLRREAEPAPVIDPVQPEETGIFGDLRKGFGSGFVGTFETGALGAATLLDEEAELAARDRIQGIASALKPKGGDQDDISYKVGQAFGSIAGFAGAGASAVGLASLSPALAPIAGGIGLGVAGGLGIGTAAGEASERARAAGATEEERTRAVRQAAPFGLIEVAPLGRLVRKIDVPFVQKLMDDLGPETVETIGQRIQSAAVTGGVEGAQEATSEIIQNLVERGYNPERAVLESSGESALLGGGAGATLQFFVDAFSNTRKAGPTPDETLLLPPPSEDELRLSPKRGLGGPPTPSGETIIAPPPPKQLTGPDDFGLTIDSKGEARTRDQKAAARAEGMQTVERARAELQETGALSMTTLQNLRSAPVPFKAVASVLENTRYEPVLSLIEGSKLPPAFGVTPSNLGPSELQDPQRLKTAVANAQGGIGALLGRQSAEKQQAARDREAMRAADRGDVEGFEQPDLLAAELEQAQKERPEAALRDDLRAQEIVDPVTSKTTKTETEPELLERDLFNAAEIGTQDTSQNIRKAREAARQKQEDIDVDTELGLREMQAEVTEPKRRTEDRDRPEQLSLFNLPSVKKVAPRGKDSTPIKLGDQDAGDQTGQGPSGVGDAGVAPSGVGKQGAANTAESITPDNTRVGYDVSGTGGATLREGEQPSALDPKGLQVIPGVKYKVDPVTLQRTGEKTFVDDPTLAPPKQRATQKDEIDYGEAIQEKLKGTKAVSRNRRGATDTTSRLSNKLHKTILDNLNNNTQTASAMNTQYLGKYLNIEDAIEDAYTNIEMTKGKKEQEVSPAVAKNVINLVEKNKTKQDEKILAELKRKGEANLININSKKTIEDTLHGERKANDYAAKLVRGNPALEREAKAGNLEAALDVLGKDKDPFIRNLATKFKTFLKGYGVKLKTAKDVTIGEEAVYAKYDAASKTITLDTTTGMDAHTLLHEIAHALTIKIATEPMSKLKGKEKVVRGQLDKLFEQARAQLQDPNSEFPTHYGLTSLPEFVSEALTNQKFRNVLLQNVVKEEKTLLGKFKDALRTLVGAPKEVTTTGELNGLLEAVMRPDPEYMGEGTYALGGRENAKKTMGDIGKVQRKLKAELPSRQTISDNFSDFVGNAKAAPRNVFLKLLASQSLADVAKRYGFKELGYALDKAILKQRGGITTATDLTRIKVEEVQNIFVRMGAEKVANLNKLIYSPDFGSTIYQVDPLMNPTDAIKQYKDKQSSDPNRTLLDIYNEQKRFINDSKLRGDGLRAYTLMRDHYKEQYERARAIVLKEIEDLGNEAGDDGAKIASKVKKDIYTKMFQGGTLEVYFPLVREGDYKLTYGLKDPKQPRDAYIVEMFTTRAERERAFKEIKADPKFTNPEKKDGELTIADYQKAPDASFAFDVVTALSKTKGPKGETIPPQAIEEVMRLFIATLPETSFAKSLQKRKGVLGYKEDSMFALRTKGYDIAVQTQKLKAASDIRAVEREVSKVKKPDNVSLSAFEDTQAELLSRGVFARQGAKSKSFEDVGRRLNQFAFVYTIGFNASSALVNLSQIPLFVQPYLGGKYGQAEAAKAIYKAGALTKNVKNSLRDFYDMDLDGNISLKSDPNMSDTMRQELLNIMPLVKEAAERGQLISQGYIAESMGLDEASRAKRKSIGGVADYASGLSAYLFNHAEKYNRQTTMVAAYKLHLDKLTGGKQPTPEQQQKAANEAIYMTQEANGGAYLETGPRLARENVGRVALMYKSYGLQMYYSMFKQALRMIDKDLPAKDRVEAFKILGGLHGSALLLAGVQGIPIYGAVRLVFNLLAGDDEEDFDAVVRRNLGEGWYKGPIVAATGLDTASRTALTGLLIQENKYNPDPSLEETIGFYMGGPALSSVTRIVRGVQDLGNGQIERGIENLMPTAVANAYKGLVRYQRDGGVYTRRGDPMYDDLNFMESSGLVFGIQPAGYTQASAINRTLKTIDKAVNSKRSKLTKLYYVALRQGDMEGVREAIAEMGKFNKRHPAAAITHRTIKRSLDRHIRTSGEMYNGVTLSSIYRAPLRELAESYEDLS